MALKKLMQMLGLGDDENDVTAEMAGLSEDEMGAMRERQNLDAQGLVPLPERENMSAAFVGPEGDVRRASSLDAARSMAGASNTVAGFNSGERERAVREAMALLGDTARKHNLPGLFPTSPEQNDQFAADEAAQQQDTSPQRADVIRLSRPAAKPAPVRSGASVANREKLAAAFQQAGVNPNTEAPEAEQLAAQAETESPSEDASEGGNELAEAHRQLGTAFAKAGRDPNAPAPDTGGPLGMAMKTVQGSTDPRLSGLEAALKERNRLLKVADAEREGGIGADIVAGTNFNSQAGAGTRARAESVVDAELSKLKQGRELSQEDRASGDYTSRQLDAEQRRKLALSSEERAQAEEGRRVAGEGRAAAEEGRKQKGFDINAGRSDPTSAVSRNARAEAEVLYGKQWARIPQEVRDSFTADDVDRLFKEVSMKELAGGARAGALSAAQQKFDDQQLVDYEKNLVQPGTVDAYNRIAGRLEDPTPIYGMGTTTKAIGGALNAIPVMGKNLSSSWTQAFNSLTPEGQGLYQDAIRVMQQITLDTTGKAMNEQELANIKARLGMAGGNENDFRNALMDELQAVQERAARQLAARNPRVQERARAAGILPQWRKRKGGVRPYALETEGRFSEAADEGGR